MASKPKVEVAREHLDKALDEASGGDLRDAVQWGFASLEAAIDALAAAESISIEEKHWKRTEAAQELHKREVLPADLSELHAELNVLRKAIFYDGDELEAEGFSVEDALVEIETAVEIAEAETK
jgi:uncharacterized protein YutE (UPF0331/DUF86 family)